VAEPIETEVDDCLAGDSVIDPIVPEKSMPVLAEAEPSAALACVDDDNAALQDCPSLAFSFQQTEASLDLFSALASIQDDSLASLQDDGSDVGASLTCTSFSDQIHAD
jgi:hypothetical protein